MARTCASQDKNPASFKDPEGEVNDRGCGCWCGGDAGERMAASSPNEDGTHSGVKNGFMSLKMHALWDSTSTSPRRSVT